MSRRWRRGHRRPPRDAHAAALAAVAEHRQKVAESLERLVIRVRGEIIVSPEGARWLIWDARPHFPEQVEGVLVPYALGTADSEEAARTAMEEAVISATGVLLLKQVTITYQL